MDSKHKTRMEVITHGKNLKKEERARFNHALTLDEIIEACEEESDGPLLLSRRDNPDNNILFQCKKH